MILEALEGGWKLEAKEEEQTELASKVHSVAGNHLNGLASEVSERAQSGLMSYLD